MKNLRFKTLTLFLGLLCLGACSSGSEDSGASQGTLSVGMTDASTDAYQAVYVTVSEIQVNASDDGDETEDGWISVGTPNKTYNLLELVNGTRETLGIVDLDAQHYSQMRLILSEDADASVNILSEAHPFGNYVIDLADEAHELKVPSGMQTGIKIVQGFDVSASGTTELILDFDAGASVVVAGNSGQYLLKPTIKVLETSEAATLAGTVTVTDDVTLAGVTVSAQVFDENASDDSDRVVVETSTISDDDGNFSLFLNPGTYNLVFYKEGYAAYATKITVAAGDTASQDADLDTSTTGTLALTSSLSDADSEAYTTVSLRQSLTVENDDDSDGDEEVQLFALNIADGGVAVVTLPVADEVLVVASSADVTTESSAVEIVVDAETVLLISL